MVRRVCIGKIATVHGVRGLVKLQHFGDDPQAFEKYGPLHTAESGGRALTLTLKGRAGKHLLAAVDGIADRDAAEALRGTELWLDRDRLPGTDEHEYYYADLIGMTVMDESGATIGTVAAIDNFGAGDLLDIRPPAGESFYLIFHRDNILSVSLEERVIVAALPAETETETEEES